MKTFYITTVIFVSLFICKAQTTKTIKDSFRNKIDDVKTDVDIDKLLDSISKKQFEVFIVREKLEVKDKECRKFSEKIQAKSWTKADFDNNGYTDLLINGESFGRSSIVVMDKGKNNFVVKDFGGMMSRCAFFVVKNSVPQPTIVYHEFNRFQSTEKELIFKYGGFIEINDNPQNYSIEKIEYKTSGCYGNCPIFELSLDGNLEALYKPIAYNKKKKGIFKGKINEAQYQEVIDLLNYIDFSNLKDEYLSGGTDQQNSYLTITYDNGKIKQIMDYSLKGTFGLRRLHEILFNLRENQNWK